MPFPLNFKCEHSMNAGVQHLSSQEGSGCCSKPSFNLKPISKRGWGFEDLSCVVLLLFHWSFGLQCNHYCNVRHQSYSLSIYRVSFVYTKLAYTEVDLIFAVIFLSIISIHIYIYNVAPSVQNRLWMAVLILIINLL